ncbi:MAG: hypothetical protein GC160_18215 [Acidobacteria bacterium]|nr:hypothetical protein [Acidobacteriota bacterium]
MRRALFMAVLFAAAAVAQDWPSPRFVSAEVCSSCHADLYPPGRTPGGSNASVGPYDLWSASMMGASVRDPYWQAKVRYETRATPAAAATIENACLSCHAPMQQYERRMEGAVARFDAVDQAGAEGVSCTVCHQIAADNLGTAASFTAGFTINEQGRIYGPHANPFPMPMRMHTGRTPTFSQHILDSALCGTCHTVITPTLSADGTTTGRFLEQATYLEWLDSSYPRSGKSCQSCHLAPLEGPDGKPAPMYIARTPHGGFFGPTRPRTPFGLHDFGGANVQGLKLMAAAEPTRAEAYQQSARRAQAMLERALTVRVEATRDGDRLTARVRLASSAGHKLPTGFPSRRLWLHLRVHDAKGRTVFESGAWDPSTGEILSRRGATGPEPHHDRIDDGRQTAIYEAELASPGGSATHSLLRAGGFAKDNRLLPLGFRDGAGRPQGLESLSLAPVGVGDDPDFRPGADKVTYVATVDPAAGPWTVTVEALFQNIKPAHAAALDGATAEERRFQELFEAVDAPTPIAQDQTTAR